MSNTQFSLWLLAQRLELIGFKSNQPVEGKSGLKLQFDLYNKKTKAGIDYTPLLTIEHVAAIDARKSDIEGCSGYLVYEKIAPKQVAGKDASDLAEFYDILIYNGTILEQLGKLEQKLEGLPKI